MQQIHREVVIFIETFQEVKYTTEVTPLNVKENTL